MASVLAQYLRDGASRPFSPATCDCTSWVADWVMIKTGKDPMAYWRGRYATKFGYLRMMCEHPGGYLEAVAEGLSSVGAVIIDPASAQPGDVGLIAVANTRRNTTVSMSIRGNIAWVAKLDRGLTHYPTAIKAWRI